MARTLSVFDNAVADAHLWVNEVAGELELDEPRVALQVLRTVLHGLRDRMPNGVTAHLSAQLPLLIRGMFFENWQFREHPVHDRDLTGLFASVEGVLDEYGATVSAQDAVQAVCDVLGAHVSLGEWRKIGKILPKELARFWGAPAA